MLGSSERRWTEGIPPLVSVVIPCYNAGKYLEDTLRSVLAQKYRPLEIIAVDDGSTDDTAVILERYSHQITTIRHDNAGRSTARNSGLRVARGKYLLFIDSDDTIEPEHLVILVGILENSGADLAYCRADAFLSANPTVRYTHRHAYYDGPEADRLLLGNFINMHCGVIRRQFLCDHAINFRRGREHSEDWEFWCRVVLNGARVVQVPRTLAHIRDHETNTSRNIVRMYSEILDILTGFETEIPGLMRSARRQRLVAMARVRALFQIGVVETFLGGTRPGIKKMWRTALRFWFLRPVDIGRLIPVTVVAGLGLRTPMQLTRVVFGQHCAAQQRVLANVPKRR